MDKKQKAQGKKQVARSKKNLASIIRRFASYHCLLFAACCLLFSSVPATAIEGLPGSTWGRASYDATGLTGSGFNGWINQGIDWVKLPGDIIFNTYIEYRYKAREKQDDYYNVYGPAIGLELKKSDFRLGMDYYWEKYPVINQNSESFKDDRHWGNGFDAIVALRN